MNEGAPKPSVPEVKQTQELETSGSALEQKQIEELHVLLSQPDPIAKIKQFLGIKESAE